MKEASFVIGAFIVGFVVPEFTTQLSRGVKIPTLQNLLTAIGFALMAYGHA